MLPNATDDEIVFALHSCKDNVDETVDWLLRHNDSKEVHYVKNYDYINYYEREY